MTRMVRRLALGLLLATLVATTTGGQVQRQPTPSLILDSIAGRDTFEFYCAPCHGRDGTGDGPVAPALGTRPADLTMLARRNGGVFPREQIVSFVAGTARPLAAHGSGDMPVWGPTFRALDSSDVRVKLRIDNVVAYVETLQANAAAPGRPPGAARIAMGGQLFSTYCASCHGANARGNGPLADKLRRTPPDLTKFTTRNGGMFPSERVYRIIDGREVPSHGDREMPIWGDAFRHSRDGFSAESVKARIDAIVAYLEAIQERAAE